MKTAFLTRFGPPSDSLPAEPTDRLRVQLTTELRGVRGSVFSDGSRLATDLTVSFSAAFAAACARATLLGLSPVGHAPLQIPGVTYADSTVSVLSGCGFILAGLLILTVLITLIWRMFT